MMKRTEVELLKAWLKKNEANISNLEIKTETTNHFAMLVNGERKQLFQEEMKVTFSLNGKHVFIGTYGDNVNMARNEHYYNCFDGIITWRKVAAWLNRQVKEAA
jgi:hypothetical protein